ncbi:N-acetyltransferase (plasmid) [Gemmobacter aquarius]|uniref:N-acetyltransferase n=2 Tax=Paragemmobacter aquarius TaxID=2169400 RepID=A0A2S0USF4_9RHOB|nr:N-acetyltransferase [Gemmobacter aquarius]
MLRRIEGPNLVLRLIRPDDAAYVRALRTDPRYNAHLSPVQGTVEDQRRWIEGYKEREAGLGELYYVIERRDGTRCGLVRLYDIKGGSFTWGSWILDEHKPPKAALESATLLYMVAFDGLGLSTATFDVRRENATTLAFHRRFGATETGETAQDVYFTYPRERFETDRTTHWTVCASV